MSAGAERSVPDGPEHLQLPTPAEQPAPTPTPVPTSVPDPTALPDPTSLPDPTPAPTAAPTAVQAPAAPQPTPSQLVDCTAPLRVEPDPARPSHELVLDVDFPARRIDATQRTTFTPDLEIDDVILRLWPNGPRQVQSGNRLTIDSIALNGEPATILPISETLVRIETEVKAGETVELDLDFTLTIGAVSNDRLASGADWFRLGTFHPVLPWEPGAGWAIEPPTAGFAEAAMTPVARYDVTITGVEDLDVLASGAQVESGRWQADAIRDFAFSVGSFDTATATVELGNPVDVTVGVHAGIGESPQAYLDRVSDSLTFFSELWGDYPWPTLTLAITPSLSGGIEFPGHIMQGPGTIGRTTPHEVAHMWFYGLVGNNQGRDPWLDEGLASYAEFRFESVQIASLVIPSELRGLSGEPMEFWEARLGSYYQGVYQAPAVALEAAGSEAEIDCALRDFVARNAWGIATPDDFLASAERHLSDPQASLGPWGLLPVR